MSGVTLEQIVDQKEILLKFETHHNNIKEETEIHLKGTVNYRRSLSSRSSTNNIPVDKVELERKGGGRNRRFSETALMYLAEDYSSQLSNKEPRFIRSNTSLASSRNELDVYAEINDYLDKESTGQVKRAQSVEILALEEEVAELKLRATPVNNMDIVAEMSSCK